MFDYLQRLKEALVEYESIQENTACSVNTYGEKGYILLTLKNPREALLAFEKALLLEKNNAYYCYGKGQALELLESYKEALEAYKWAYNYGLQSAEFFVHYALLLTEQGDEELVNDQEAQAEELLYQCFSVL